MELWYLQTNHSTCSTETPSKSGLFLETRTDFHCFLLSPVIVVGFKFIRCCFRCFDFSGELHINNQLQPDLSGRVTGVQKTYSLLQSLGKGNASWGTY